MIRHTSAFNFADTVTRIMEEYKGEVKEELRQTVDEVSREGVKRVRASSRQYNNGRLHIGVTIYGKDPTYRLAHLLEKGHASRNQYGSYGRVRGRTHIKPVEEWAEKEAETVFRRKIEGG